MRIAALAILLLLPVAAAHPSAPDHGGPGLAAYDPLTSQLVHRLPDVQDTFARWDADWPGMVERQVIGTTGTLDLPLETVRLTDESVAFDEADTLIGHKFRIYLDGGHHGNEFLGVDIIMYYLEGLLQSAAAGDEAMTYFFQTHEVYATPIVNVEGNFLDTRKNANQVDVNRNYGFEFGGPGSGSMITDMNYRGPSAFSEPEVAANAEFARTILPDLWITMHTGVAEFYWPWGWTYDKSPDWEFFEGLEEPFEKATNGRVDAMMAAELYLAAGATDDWGYGQLGIPTHTFEVHEDQFVPIYGQGVPSAITDQIAGLDWMVMNTGFLGATMLLHEQQGEFHVYNAGWGRAENITVTWQGGDFVIPRLEPGEMHVFDPAPAADFTVTYRQLLIDAPEAKDRVATYSMQAYEEPQETPAEEAPAVGFLAILVLLGIALRRR